MIFNRTAPLGIVLLAPFVVVILFTHLMLNGSSLFGILLASLLGVFAWQFREAYRPMWNYKNRGFLKGTLKNMQTQTIFSKLYSELNYFKPGTLKRFL